MVEWPAIPVLYLLDTTWPKNGMTHCEDEATLKEVVDKPPATVHSFVDTSASSSEKRIDQIIDINRFHLLTKFLCVNALELE